MSAGSPKKSSPSTGVVMMTTGATSSLKMSQPSPQVWARASDPADGRGLASKRPLATRSAAFAAPRTTHPVTAVENPRLQRFPRRSM